MKLTKAAIRRKKHITVLTVTTLVVLTVAVATAQYFNGRQTNEQAYLVAGDALMCCTITNSPLYTKSPCTVRAPTPPSTCGSVANAEPAADICGGVGTYKACEQKPISTNLCCEGKKNDGGTICDEPTTIPPDQAGCSRKHGSGENRNSKPYPCDKENLCNSPTSSSSAASDNINYCCITGKYNLDVKSCDITDHSFTTANCNNNANNPGLFNGALVDKKACAACGKVTGYCCVGNDATKCEADGKMLKSKCESPENKGTIVSDCKTECTKNSSSAASSTVSSSVSVGPKYCCLKEEEGGDGQSCDLAVSDANATSCPAPNALVDAAGCEACKPANGYCCWAPGTPTQRCSSNKDYTNILPTPSNKGYCDTSLGNKIINNCATCPTKSASSSSVEATVSCCSKTQDGEILGCFNGLPKKDCTSPSTLIGHCPNSLCPGPTSSSAPSGICCYLSGDETVCSPVLTDPSDVRRCNEEHGNFLAGKNEEYCNANITNASVCPQPSSSRSSAPTSSAGPGCGFANSQTNQGNAQCGGSCQPGYSCLFRCNAINGAVDCRCVQTSSAPTSSSRPPINCYLLSGNSNAMCGSGNFSGW